MPTAPTGFDWQKYLSSYSDLGAAGLKTEQDALWHYNTYGANEGRTAPTVSQAVVGPTPPSTPAPAPTYSTPTGFDWNQYVKNYGDLSAAGIDTADEAAWHYSTYGQNEGRNWAAPQAVTTPVAIKKHSYATYTPDEWMSFSAADANEAKKYMTREQAQALLDRMTPEQRQTLYDRNVPAGITDSAFMPSVYKADGTAWGGRIYYDGEGTPKGIPTEGGYFSLYKTPTGGMEEKQQQLAYYEQAQQPGAIVAGPTTPEYAKQQADTLKAAGVTLPDGYTPPPPPTTTPTTPARPATPPAQTGILNTGRNYTTASTTGVDYNTETTEGRIQGLLSQNSLVLRQAGDRALEQFAARGLLNTSMAQEGALEAMISKAIEIAGPDAERYFQNSQTNRDWINKFAQTAQAQEYTQANMALQQQYAKELESLQQGYTQSNLSQQQSFTLQQNYLQSVQNYETQYNNAVNAIQQTEMSAEDKTAAIEMMGYQRDNNIFLTTRAYEAMPLWQDEWSKLTSVSSAPEGINVAAGPQAHTRAQVHQAILYAAEDPSYMTDEQFKVWVGRAVELGLISAEDAAKL